MSSAMRNYEIALRVGIESPENSLIVNSCFPLDPQRYPDCYPYELCAAVTLSEQRCNDEIRRADQPAVHGSLSNSADKGSLMIHRHRQDPARGAVRVFGQQRRQACRA